MFNTAFTCRQREAHHLREAEQASLPNARAIALLAARAWETQALEAEAREAGVLGISDEDAAIALEFLLEEDMADDAGDDLPDDEDTAG